MSVIKLKRRCKCGSQYYEKHTWLIWNATLQYRKDTYDLMHNFQCVKCGDYFERRGLKIVNLR